MSGGLRHVRGGSGWALLALGVLACGGDIFAAEPAGSRSGGGVENGPTLQEALSAKADVWGEAALRRPEGPSYQFFAKLMPPLRYVNTPFRHYPIVLSAPQSLCKARLVSNGSAINAKARQPVGWRADVGGLAVGFLVGPGQAPFGADLDRLDGPRYAEGYLPIVQMSYQEGAAAFHEEAFVAAGKPWGENAAVFTSFGLERGRQGLLAAQVQSPVPLQAADGVLRDREGRAQVWFGRAWRPIARPGWRCSPALPARCRPVSFPARPTPTSGNSASIFGRGGWAEGCNWRCPSRW